MVIHHVLDSHRIAVRAQCLHLLTQRSFSRFIMSDMIFFEVIHQRSIEVEIAMDTVWAEWCVSKTPCSLQANCCRWHFRMYSFFYRGATENACDCRTAPRHLRKRWAWTKHCALTYLYKLNNLGVTGTDGGEILGLSAIACSLRVLQIWLTHPQILCIEHLNKRIKTNTVKTRFNVPAFSEIPDLMMILSCPDDSYKQCNLHLMKTSI
jgi:hypothetical protein